MRLIGTFETEKEAYAFYFFLLKQGIQNIYEAHTDPEKERKEYFLWIYDEEDFQTASDWLNHYKQNPQDPQFHTADPPIAPASATAYRETSEEEESKWQSPQICLEKRVHS